MSDLIYSFYLSKKIMEDESKYENTLVKKVKLLCLLSQNPEIATRQLTYLKYPKNDIKILPLISNVYAFFK